MNTKVLAPLLFVAGLALAYAVGMFDSDDTRIRNLFANAASSFNATRLSGCLDGFAEDYKDETEWKVDRALLANALRIAFLRSIDSKSKAFLLRLKIPEASMKVAIDEAAETATVELSLSLERRRGETFDPQWQLQVVAKLKKIDGDWLIHESTHETLEGSRPR